MDTVPIKYSVGSGNPVDRMEVIIYSWDRKLDPVGLF
jgi:DNA adenine methylase